MDEAKKELEKKRKNNKPHEYSENDLDELARDARLLKKFKKGKQSISKVSAASNHLGLSLLRCLSKDGGNVFISPFSLSTALAMLHCGSRGRTRDEMSSVLGYEAAGLGNEEVHSAFGQLMSSLKDAPKSYVLSCANSLVMDIKFSVKDEYKALLKASFDATLHEANFLTQSKTAVTSINTWVKEKTNGMIPEVLDELGPYTVAVLLNAIYFKGTWMHKFQESSTRLQNFYNKGLNAKKVQMMHRTARFGYAERESFTVLQLPYIGEGVAMMVLLPRSMDGIGELEAQLTPELFGDLKKQLRQAKAYVSLPKFTLEYSKKMTEILQSLGMKDAFEFGADLAGMSDSKDLKVDEVIHKAVVKVNEEGSEAAAATGVMKGIGCTLRFEQIVDFVVDHPFLFAILDIKKDVILFLGKLNEL